MGKPVENSLLSWWRTEPHPLDNHLSSEAVPEHSDVVIIGSGVSGVSVAYHLLNDVRDQQRAPSITIVEARQACSGATGRNGKFSPTNYSRSFHC